VDRLKSPGELPARVWDGEQTLKGAWQQMDDDSTEADARSLWTKVGGNTSNLAEFDATLDALAEDSEEMPILPAEASTRTEIYREHP
jgi:hypothetical protein